MAFVPILLVHGGVCFDGLDAGYELCNAFSTTRLIN